MVLEGRTDTPLFVTLRSKQVLEGLTSYLLNRYGARQQEIDEFLEPYVHPQLKPNYIASSCAVVFDTYLGTVIRVSSEPLIPLPESKWVNQRIAGKSFEPDNDSRITVEVYPKLEITEQEYARQNRYPPGNLFHDAAFEVEAGLRAEGIPAFDLHIGNVGKNEGDANWKVLDPGCFWI